VSIAWLDTEGKGLIGPTSTLQVKWTSEEPTIVYRVWDEPARVILRIIERLVEVEAVGGFKLTHDWFHIQMLYCVLRLLDPARPPTANGWCQVMREARFGPCVKPRSALDLMLYVMRGPLQATMERDDIRLRKVPIQLAHLLAQELKARIPLPGIYFHYRESGYEWRVEPIEDKPGFADVVLRWGASRGLKQISRHVMGLKDVLDYDMPKQFMPKERLFDPYGTGWVQHSNYHDAYWRLDKRAQQYARDDVERLTFGLWEYLGRPAHGDTDSILACLVGSSRWRGFALDLELLKQIRDQAHKAKEAFPRAPKPVLYGLRQRCSPMEAINIEDTCAETLTEIAGSREGDSWKGGWGDQHPAAQFARGVVVARSKDKEEDMAEKLLSVGSFHPDMNIIGALSGRGSGAGGINMHGVPGAQKGSHMRESFLLADGRVNLNGEADEFLMADRGWSMWEHDFEWAELLDAGDFDSFEVAIAAAVYNDENLTADLRSGKKIHAIYASIMLELDYDVVMKKENKSIYNDGKRAFLGRLYGAQDPKVSKVLNRPIEQIRRNEAKLAGRYPGIGRARQLIAEQFCSMKQMGDVGSRIEWHEPADRVESLFGYARYFTLENQICRALFELGQSPPGEFRDTTAVQRTAGRTQTAGGALQSAIFGCAFNIQASAMRQAANHQIQSTGAQITKELQRAIWDVQPAGIHAWLVRPMQIHDEIQCPRQPHIDLRSVVAGVIERFRPRIPLLKMEWLQGLRNWAEKG
jgi:hypothetical protein